LAGLIFQMTDVEAKTKLKEIFEKTWVKIDDLYAEIIKK
jgi:hypothetical protein